MSYNIEQISNGYLLTVSNSSMSWADKPDSYAFKDWKELLEYLQNNTITEDNKEENKVL